MAKVVMLTAIVGDGIDIVCGDAVECSDGEANSLLVVGYAREFAADGSDDKLPLKRINPAAATVEPAEPSNTNPLRQPAARNRRHKGTKDAKGSQG